MEQLDKRAAKAKKFAAMKHDDVARPEPKRKQKK
jgi:hypothetical protein